MIFHAKRDKLQLLNVYKVNPAPFMLKYNFQPVVTSFISIALMMMTIGVLILVYYPTAIYIKMIGGFEGEVVSERSTLIEKREVILEKLY